MWTEDCNSVPQPHANRIIGTHKKNAKEVGQTPKKFRVDNQVSVASLSETWVKFDGNYIMKAYEGGNQPLLTFKLES